MRHSLRHSFMYLCTKTIYMPSVKFIVRNSKIQKETPIYLICHLPKRKRLRISAKINIEPQYWDEKKQMVRNKVEVANKRDLINSYLFDLKNYVEKKIIELINSNNFTVDLLKIEIENFFSNNQDVTKPKYTFIEYIEYFILQSENRVAMVTIRSYKRTLDILKSYIKKNKKPIFFESIDIDFYNSFYKFMDSYNYKINTKGKHFKNIKAFMNAANEDGYTTQKGHEHKYFKILREESFDVYLTKEELLKIKQIDYPFDSLKDKVRDWFLLGAYTGQRVSDWEKINKMNFVFSKDQTQVIKFKQAKTETEVVLPIHPIVKEIFEKRDGMPPKKISEQVINRYIKEIAKEANIVENIPQADNEPKYNLISTHTARRSFCTNAYKSGLDSLAIMQLSGHKTEKNFLTYIKVGKEEFASRIANHEFFKS